MGPTGGYSRIPGLFILKPSCCWGSSWELIDNPHAQCHLKGPKTGALPLYSTSKSQIKISPVGSEHGKGSGQEGSPL